jgi:hypothetical protein
MHAVQQIRRLTHSVNIELPSAQNVLVFAQESIASGIERKGHISARPRPYLCGQMSIDVTREGQLTRISFKRNHRIKSMNSFVCSARGRKTSNTRLVKESRAAQSFDDRRLYGCAAWLYLKTCVLRSHIREP